MQWQSQAEYDAFVDEIAREALAVWVADDLSRNGDGQWDAQDYIGLCADSACTGQVSRGQVIAYFNGDEGDLVINESPSGMIDAEAVARLDCDIRDRMWKLRDAALGGR
jgi:hypothetical protein